MARQIAIGDIHGCLDTFNALLEKMKLTQSDELIFLGDYIDRGWNSKGIIDKIESLQKENYQIVTLRGNHEQMLIDYYDEAVEKNLKGVGDARLLQSFSVSNIKYLPIEYIGWCRKLPLYYLTGNYILVHAGLNFNHQDPLTDEVDIIWIRNWYAQINKKWLGNRIIIHGHTPQSRMETAGQYRNMKKQQVLNLDCGAFLSQYKQKGLGYLSAFDMTNEKLYFQENIDKDNIY